MYIVYRTTNKINNHYYIGIHKTNNLNDGYLGSGVAIKNAIKKYGKENFIRQVLFYCESDQQMKQKQRQMVTEEVLKDPMCYNITLGGGGGFYYINNTEIKSKCIEKMKRTKRLNGDNVGEKNPMFGKKHSQQARDKISKSKKGNLIGDKNPSKRPQVRQKIKLSKLGLSNPNSNRWKLTNPQGQQFMIQGGIKRALKLYGLSYQMFVGDGKIRKSIPKRAGWTLQKLT